MAKLFENISVNSLIKIPEITKVLLRRDVGRVKGPNIIHLICNKLKDACVIVLTFGFCDGPTTVSTRTPL